MKTVNILGVNISALSMQQTIEMVRQIFDEELLHCHIVTPNPEMLMEAKSNPKFRDLLNRVWIAVPDGVGLQLAAELYSKQIPNIIGIREVEIFIQGVKLGLRAFFNPKSLKVIPERVSGVDLFGRIAEEAEKRGWKIFLLGGESGDVSGKARAELISMYPDLQVVGAMGGGQIDDLGVGSQDEEIIAEINKTQPDVLLVSFRAPVQDYWIDRNLKKMDTVKLAMGGGGTLDFIIGKQKRAPSLVRRFSLEWLWRLVHQPTRIKRILTAFPVFPLTVAVDKYRMVK